MKEDKLNPEKDNLVPKWNMISHFKERLFNNRGEVGGEGGEGGEGDKGGEGGEGDKGGGTATLTDWRADLDPSIRDHPSLANFKTPADVAKSYVNAQHLIGKEKIPIPSKDADPMQEGGNQEYNTIYDRLGRPSDPKAYELPVVEGSPEITKETADEFRALSHKIGLLPHQVKALYLWNQEGAKGQVIAHQEGIQKSLVESEATMRKEMGTAFDANITGAKNLITKFGGQEVMQALDESGLGNNPHIIRMMVKISQQFNEDGNIQLGDTQPNILTPDEANAEIDKIKSDKSGAYWNTVNDKGKKPFTDVEHKAMVEKVSGLYQMANPQKK